MAAVIQQTYNQACQSLSAVAEKPKDLFKIFKYGVSAVRLASTELNVHPTIKAAGVAFSIMTTGFAFKDCSKQLLQIPEKLFNLVTNPSGSKAMKLIMGACDALATSYDFFDWGRIAGVAEIVVPFTLSTAISCALVFSSVKRVVDIVEKLDRTTQVNYGNGIVESPLSHHVRKLNVELSGETQALGEIDSWTATKHLVADLAKNVMFAALGAFLLLSAFGIFQLGAVPMLALKVVALTASILKTYHATDITDLAFVPGNRNRYIA